MSLITTVSEGDSGESGWIELTHKSSIITPGDKDLKVRCQVSPAVGEENNSNPHHGPNKMSQPQKRGGSPNSTNNVLRHESLTCLGFPNPAQICYMNSCLQSLLTLEDFIGDISRQKRVWSVSSEAELIRCFMDIRDSHLSSDFMHKIFLLNAFKKAVAAFDPEFIDPSQKDALEFLMSVLAQMRVLGQHLQAQASRMNGTYSCPVEDHLVFKMQYTRICNGCGKESKREEEFTQLSLDIPARGGTIQQCLQDYLKEMELEYKCKCGATVSRLRTSFATLPKVLILQLKRFQFTPFYQLMKIHDPVLLLREIMVSSKKDDACYSLASIISHIGITTNSGHYICDGVDPDVGQVDPTDRWFTYNDEEVTETSGASVCDRRKRISYILFYKRQE